MDIKEAVIGALQETILPELAALRQKMGDMDTKLLLLSQGQESVNKRLDDINTHLVDQSRRIDAIREELTGRIESMRAELTGQINETNKRIDAVREDLTGQIIQTNKRLDRLYEVIVRRDEHYGLENRLARLEQDVAELKQRLAA